MNEFEKWCANHGVFKMNNKWVVVTEEDEERYEDSYLDREG
jgi:hypothetical protein